MRRWYNHALIQKKMSTDMSENRIITYPDSPFELHQPFAPAGDQPTAIATLVEGVNDGLSFQTLLEVPSAIYPVKMILI